MFSIDEHMNRYVLTVGPQQTLEEGAQAMMERRVGSAMVVAKAGFIGIITERDVLRAVANGRVPWSTKIEDVMTSEPICAPPTIDVREATSLMMEHGFRHLPIVENGKLIGILSLRDILMAGRKSSSEAKAS